MTKVVSEIVMIVVIELRFTVIGPYFDFDGNDITSYTDENINSPVIVSRIFKANICAVQIIFGYFIIPSKLP